MSSLGNCISCSFIHHVTLWLRLVVMHDASSAICVGGAEKKERSKQLATSMWLVRSLKPRGPADTKDGKKRGYYHVGSVCGKNNMCTVEMPEIPSVNASGG